jgi:hypothetical protein
MATWPADIDVYERVLAWLNKNNIEIVSPSDLRADYFQTKKEQRAKLSILTTSPTSRVPSDPNSTKSTLKLDSPLFMRRKNSQRTMVQSDSSNEEKAEDKPHLSIFCKKD